MLRLKVDNGAVKAIAAEVGVDRHTVSLALKGASSSPLARQVRALAIAKYNAKALKEVALTEKEMLDGMGIES